jgi:hypothetical protein
MSARVMPFSKHADNLDQVIWDILNLIQRMNGLLAYENTLLDQSWSYGGLSDIMQPLMDEAREQASGIRYKMIPHCSVAHRNVVKVTSDGAIDYFAIANSGGNTTITPHQITALSNASNLTFNDYYLSVDYVKLSSAEDTANNGVHTLVSANASGVLTVSGTLTENTDDESIVIEAYSGTQFTA